MLILTRRPDESIRISSQIRITLLGYRGNQAIIGIDAPPDVAVDREEVYLRKLKEEGQESGDAPGNDDDTR